MEQHASEGVERQRARSEAIHLAELPSPDHDPLEIVAVRRLEVESAVVLLRVPVERAEHVVTATGDTRVAHLKKNTV